MTTATNPEQAMREIAAAGGQSPFGFDEFERRRAQAARRGRAVAWGVATSVGLLALVGLLAWMTQVPRPDALVVQDTMEPADRSHTEHMFPRREPALVDLGQFDVTSEIEDHIALLDAQISAARVYSAPVEQLRQLERTRAQLNESLQRVSYAQNLLNF
jgi:hypothetical protein